MAISTTVDDEFYDEVMARATEVAYFVSGTTGNSGPIAKVDSQVELSDARQQGSSADNAGTTTPTLPLQELEQKKATTKRCLTDDDDGGKPGGRNLHTPSPPPPPPVRTLKVTPSPTMSPNHSAVSPTCITPPHDILSDLTAANNKNELVGVAKIPLLNGVGPPQSTKDDEDSQEGRDKVPAMENVQDPSKKISIHLLDLSHPLSFVSADGSNAASIHDKDSATDIVETHGSDSAVVHSKSNGTDMSSGHDVRGGGLVEGMWESTATLPASNVRPSLKLRKEEERKLKELKEEQTSTQPAEAASEGPSAAVLAEQERQAKLQQEKLQNENVSKGIVTLHTGDEPDDLSLDEMFSNQRHGRRRESGSRSGRHRKKGHDDGDGSAQVAKRGQPPQGIFVPSHAVPQSTDKNENLWDGPPPASHSPAPDQIVVESPPTKKNGENDESGKQGIAITKNIDNDLPVNELAFVVHTRKDDDSDEDRPSKKTWIIRFTVCFLVLLIVGLSVGTSLRDDDDRSPIMAPSTTPAPTLVQQPGYIFSNQFLGSMPGGRFGTGVALSHNGNLMVATGVGGENDDVPIKIFTRASGGDTWIPLNPLKDEGGISSSTFSSDGSIAIASSPEGIPRLAVVAEMSVRVLEYVNDMEWMLTPLITFGLEWISPTGTQPSESVAGRLSDVSVSSVSMSRDGSVLVAGGLNDDGMAIVVRAFALSSFSQEQRWETRGEPLVLRPATSLPILSTSLALSGSGDRLVVSDWVLSYPGASIQTYEWTEADSKWNLVASAEINFPLGPAGLAISGDGHRLGVALQSSGTSHVYEWSIETATWVQLGSDLGLGSSIDLDEYGTRVLIGSPLSNQVKVLEYHDGDWRYVGGDSDGPFTDGLNGSEFGSDVAISSDGSVVAIGAPLDDDNGADAGKVLAYRMRTVL